MKRTETSSSAPEDRKLFVEGIERLGRQQDPTPLYDLQNRFPESPWAVQAETLLNLVDRIRQQQEQLQRVQQQLSELSSDTHLEDAENLLDQCLSESQRLQQELDVSNQRLEALRELTIELELK